MKKAALTTACTVRGTRAYVVIILKAFFRCKNRSLSTCLKTKRDYQHVRISRTAAASATRTSIHYINEYDFLMMMSIL